MFSLKKIGFLWDRISLNIPPPIAVNIAATITALAGRSIFKAANDPSIAKAMTPTASKMLVQNGRLLKNSFGVSNTKVTVATAT